MLTSGRTRRTFGRVIFLPPLPPPVTRFCLSSQPVFAFLSPFLSFSFSDLPFSSFHLSIHCQGVLLLPFLYSLPPVRKGVISCQVRCLLAFNFTPSRTHATKINGGEWKQAPCINNASALCSLKAWVPELVAGWAQMQTCWCTFAHCAAARSASRLTGHG